MARKPHGMSPLAFKHKANFLQNVRRLINWDENQAPLGRCFRMEDSAQPRTNLVMERLTDRSLANIVCSSGEIRLRRLKSLGMHR